MVSLRRAGLSAGRVNSPTGNITFQPGFSSARTNPTTTSFPTFSSADFTSGGNSSYGLSFTTSSTLPPTESTPRQSTTPKRASIFAQRWFQSTRPICATAARGSLLENRFSAHASSLLLFWSQTMGFDRLRTGPTWSRLRWRH